MPHSRIHEPDRRAVWNRLAHEGESWAAELRLQRLPVRLEVRVLPHRFPLYAGFLAGKDFAQTEGSRRRTSLQAFARSRRHFEARQRIQQSQSRSMRDFSRNQF